MNNEFTPIKHKTYIQIEAVKYGSLICNIPGCKVAGALGCGGTVGDGVTGAAGATGMSSAGTLGWGQRQGRKSRRHRDGRAGGTSGAGAPGCKVAGASRCGTVARPTERGRRQGRRTPKKKESDASWKKEML